MRISGFTFPFKKLSGPKWLWLAGLIFLILFGTVSILKIFFLENWLEKKVTGLVAEKSKGLYTLHIGNLDASLLGGSITRDRTGKFTPEKRAVGINI